MRSRRRNDCRRVWGSPDEEEARHEDQPRTARRARLGSSAARARGRERSGDGCAEEARHGQGRQPRLPQAARHAAPTASRRPRATAPATGVVSARLTATGGDWDLAVFDAQTGKNVAGSAAFRSRELAEGFVTRRPVAGRPGLPRERHGRQRERRHDVRHRRHAQRRQGRRSSTSSTRTRGAKARRLQSLGLDLTEHGDADSVEVLAPRRGATAATLRGAGFELHASAIADLARARTRQRAPRTTTLRRRRPQARSCRAAATPYRRLADYEARAEGARRRATRTWSSRSRCNHRRSTGRDVARHRDHPERAGAATASRSSSTSACTTRASGRPAEHAIEFAYDLVHNYGTSDAHDHARRHARARSSCRSSTPTASTSPARRGTRASSDVVQPVRLRDEAQELPDPATRRAVRGRRLRRQPGRAPAAASTPTATTAASGAARAPSTVWFDATYRGAGAVLRARGRRTSASCSRTRGRSRTSSPTTPTRTSSCARRASPTSGLPLEEPSLRGARRAHGRATTATRTSRASASTTRPAAPRTGRSGPPARSASRSRSAPTSSTRRTSNGVVDEYLGRGQAAGAGKGGNREAYYEMLAATAEHGAALGDHRHRRRRLDAEHRASRSRPRPRRSGPTTSAPTSAPVRRSPTRSRTTMATSGGTFEWDVNPSTRPDRRRPRRAPAERRDAGEHPVGRTRPGIPAENAVYPPGGPVEDVRRSTVLGGVPDGYDNGRFNGPHRLGRTPENDWDVYVYDADGNTRRVVGLVRRHDRGRRSCSIRRPGPTRP